MTLLALVATSAATAQDAVVEWIGPWQILRITDMLSGSVRFFAQQSADETLGHPSNKGANIVVARYCDMEMTILAIQTGEYLGSGEARVSYRVGDNGVQTSDGWQIDEEGSSVVMPSLQRAMDLLNEWVTEEPEELVIEVKPLHTSRVTARFTTELTRLAALRIQELCNQNSR